MFVKTYSLKGNENVVLEDFGGKNRSKTDNFNSVLSGSTIALVVMR